MHYKEVCKYCDKVISQCRCPSPHKEIRLSVCAACKDKQPKQQQETSALKSRVAELTAENARLTALVAAADGLRKAMALISKMETTHGDWDEGCFYFNNTAAPEMQQPLVKCREAVTAYDNAKKG